MSYTPRWVIERVNAVADHYRVSYSEVCGRGRHPLVVRVRGVAVVLCRDYRSPTGIPASYPDIAGAMARPGSHTTAQNAYVRIKRDPEASEAARRVAEALGLEPMQSAAA